MCVNFAAANLDVACAEAEACVEVQVSKQGTGTDYVYARYNLPAPVQPMQGTPVASMV